VFAYVNPQDSVSAAFAQSADNFLQEVVTRAQRQLGATEGKLPAGEPIVNWRGAAKDLHLIAYKDGRIAVVDRDTTSVVTAASLLAHAIDSMSTIGELEWSADSARDSVRFDIAFVRPILDSAGHVTKATFRAAGRTGLFDPRSVGTTSPRAAGTDSASLPRCRTA
jgi:hypothetical protein